MTHPNTTPIDDNIPLPFEPPLEKPLTVVPPPPAPEPK